LLLHLRGRQVEHPGERDGPGDRSDLDTEIPIRLDGEQDTTLPCAEAGADFDQT
jgi:hypothetical protein